MKGYRGFTAEQRYASMDIIKKAIADGRLKDPRDLECEICGQNKGVREWHCTNYDPDVLLNHLQCLCWKCHRNLHIYEIGEKHEKYEWAKRYFEKLGEGYKYEPKYTRFYTKEMEEEYENRRDAHLASAVGGRGSLIRKRLQSQRRFHEGDATAETVNHEAGMDTANSCDAGLCDN